MSRNFIFLSESVTDGHPDKLCDQISDALVDRFLHLDPGARVEAECAVSTGVLFIAAYYAANGTIDAAAVARSVLDRIGYREPQFNARDCTIMLTLNRMDGDGSAPLDETGIEDDDAIDALPARAQVTAFGYACDQSAALMPLPISLAHDLARRLTAVRRDGTLGYLSPDGKTQVGIEYEGRRARRIHSLTVLTAPASDRPVPAERLERDLREAVIEAVFAGQELRPDDDTRIYVNPGNHYGASGPAWHSGLTGRKTAIDTYGEYARHSGAALSGKDPGRIDRTAAYIARYAAKNVVAAGLARECELHLAYVIGQARPLGVHVNAFGTAVIAEEEIEARLKRLIDFRPAAIVRRFGLRSGFGDGRAERFEPLAVFGQLGRLDIDLPWERTDLAEALRD